MTATMAMAAVINMGLNLPRFILCNAGFPSRPRHPLPALARLSAAETVSGALESAPEMQNDAQR